jgi:hypothetical protein
MRLGERHADMEHCGFGAQSRKAQACLHHCAYRPLIKSNVSNGLVGGEMRPARKRVERGLGDAGEPAMMGIWRRMAENMMGCGTW